MVKFSVLYAFSEHGTFDFDYYNRVHAEMVKEKVGDLLVDIALERGVSGLKATHNPPFTAIATLTFNSAEDLESGLYPHLSAISADIMNFTDIAPNIMISEIVEQAPKNHGESDDSH